MSNSTVIHGIHGDRISVGPRRPARIHVVQVRYPGPKHRCIGVWALNIKFLCQIGRRDSMFDVPVASLACEGPTESRNRLLGSSCRWPDSAAPSSTQMTESSCLATIPTDTFCKNTFSVIVLLFGHIGQRRRIVRRASRLSSPIPTACRSLGADFENFRRPILMYASLAATSSDSFQLLR